MVTFFGVSRLTELQKHPLVLLIQSRDPRNLTFYPSDECMWTSYFVLAVRLVKD